MKKEVQFALANLHKLVKFGGQLYMGRRFSPIEMVFELPEKGYDGPELIINKKMDLNSKFVNWVAVEMKEKFETPADLTKNLDYKRFDCLYNERPQRGFNWVECKNYEDGIINLFEKLKRSYIFICRPAVRGQHNGEISVVVWNKYIGAFFLIAQNGFHKPFEKTEGWDYYITHIEVPKQKEVSS